MTEQSFLDMQNKGLSLCESLNKACWKYQNLKLSDCYIESLQSLGLELSKTEMLAISLKADLEAAWYTVLKETNKLKTV